MKEVVVQNWCDGEHAMRQPATHANQEITLRAGKRFTVDLCEGCYGSMVRPLETIVHEHGVPIKASMPAGGKKKHSPQGPQGKGPHVCRDCGFGAWSKSGLGLHAQRKHNKKLADVQQESDTL